jgi:hypothetical protein
MRDQVCFILSCVIAILLFSSVQASSAARISVQDMNVRPNGETSATLVLDAIPQGISVYDITANVTDPAKALITRVEYPSWAKFSRPHAAPAGDARLMIINDGSAPRDNLLLATVTITGIAPGDAILALTIHELRDTKGEVVPVEVSGGAILVSGESAGNRPVSASVQGAAVAANESIPATPARHAPGFGVVLGIAGTFGAVAVIARGRSA